MPSAVTPEAPRAAVGVLGNDARAMGVVIVSALVLGVLVLLLLVRPWRSVDDGGSEEIAAAVVAH